MSSEKQELKEFFIKCKPYIRFLPILKELNIQQSNFSQFISGSNNNAISVDKLTEIRKKVVKITNNISINEI